ncbi:hypothetical protein JCM9534A_78290 [Catenuloplanes indicus JCM 9534]
MAGLRRGPGAAWPHVAKAHIQHRYEGFRAAHPDDTWTTPRSDPTCHATVTSAAAGLPAKGSARSGPLRGKVRCAQRPAAREDPRCIEKCSLRVEASGDDATGAAEEPVTGHVVPEISR